MEIRIFNAFLETNALSHSRSFGLDTLQCSAVLYIHGEIHTCTTHTHTHAQNRVTEVYCITAITSFFQSLWPETIWQFLARYKKRKNPK